LKFEEVVHCPFLPEKVPKLVDRLKNATEFREFASNTF